MKLTVQKLNECIDTFAKTEISKSAKMNTQFKIGWAREFGLLSVNEKHLNKMREFGIADAEGNVDLDMLKRGIYAGIKESGEFYVEDLGIYLAKPDFDKFFRLCETGAID